jgi:16S rRNA (adenine1518-N6/adenine1519-N6)-dimethyltransferase
VRKLVHEAFAHRRKALAKSLSLAQGADTDIRERARAALAQMGLPEDVRAERLTAEQFATLAGLIEPSAQPDQDGQ